MSDASIEPPKLGKWLTPSTVLLIITGIFVPIVAALISLIPTAIEYFKTKENFTYTTLSVAVGDRVAFRVVVRNRGRVVERNVEVWLREDKARSLEIDLAGAPPGTKLRDDSQHKVISLGDLRPGEWGYVAAMVTSKASPGAGSHYYGGFKELIFDFTPMIRVISADRTASRAFDGQREPSVMDFVYRIGFWAFVIVLLAGVIWAISARLRRA